MREPRVRPGSRGHESPANETDRPKMSERRWTRVPPLVFPQCSLAPLRSMTTHLLRGRLGCDRVELPLAGDAHELVGATVLEDDPGTDDCLLNGLRRQYLVWPRERADSG